MFEIFLKFLNVHSLKSANAKDYIVWKDISRLSFLSFLVLWITFKMVAKALC
jgi:hypothetical protein